MQCLPSIFFITSTFLIFCFLFRVFASFECKDGCSINDDYLDDNYCDCTSCEDEPNWSCNSCPGCPVTCGEYSPCIGNTTFTCDNGCSIPSAYFNDSFCDCNTCEDEPNYNCTTCLRGCPSNTLTNNCSVNELHVCYNPKCHDGCEIEWQFINDNFCDCSECEDEANWTCTSCLEACPSDGESGYCGSSSIVGSHTHLCDFSAIMTQYSFMYDCKIGWQEMLVLILEGIILSINILLVGYFSYEMILIGINEKRHGVAGMQKRFKILISICHVVYLFDMMLSLWTSYVVFTRWQSCYWKWDIDYKNLEIIFDVGNILWQKMFYLAFIFVYITFAQRFETSVTGSMFESKKLIYYLRITSAVLGLLWVWSISITFVKFSHYWENSDSPDYVDYSNSPGKVIITLEQDTIRIVLYAYIVCSIIVITMFIFKFKQIITTVVNVQNIKASQNDHVHMHDLDGGKSGAGGDGRAYGNSQSNASYDYRKSVEDTMERKRYDSYLSIVSKITTLSGIALTSTILYMICQIVFLQFIWNKNEYAYEYMSVIFGIDSTINILCLNLNFTHGSKLYTKLGCSKLEKQGKICVDCCFDGCKNSCTCKRTRRLKSSNVNVNRNGLELPQLSPTVTPIEINE